MAKLFVKKGDKVLVIAGKDKGKTADVLEVSPSTGKVLVDGVNVVSNGIENVNGVAPEVFAVLFSPFAVTVTVAGLVTFCLTVTT